MRPVKLSYVRLAGTRQIKHPTTGQAKPVLTGNDLDITYEDGLVTVLSLQTGEHVTIPVSSVEFMTRAEWPVVTQQNAQQGQRR